MEGFAPGCRVMSAQDHSAAEDGAAARPVIEPNSTTRSLAFGAAIAAIVAVVDQLSKLWVLFVFDLPDKGAVVVTRFMDLVMTWNPGISYGLFRQEGRFGQWPLLAVTAIALVLLAFWLRRAETRLTAASLGLIIGGAIGNSVDRIAYGAVADFVLLHITTATYRFNWYVFNVADIAIVAGVIGILYETLLGRRAAKAP
jgi:signal peptidase II